jgi:uncharacterized protein (DUF305 family)
MTVMPDPTRSMLTLAIASTAASLVLARDVGLSPAAEGRYLAENKTAMTRMMTGMTVKPSGDVDRDFVAMMIPHHQGAIDMAIAVLCYGRNEKIRRLAQEIIVTQQQEIVAMRMAVGESLPPSVAPSTPHTSPCEAMPSGIGGIAK